jgi:TRAP-type mannitol/chloroaromatic compound transport system permease large subunit
MLTVMIGAIFIGFPISFTMLFLAFVFGYFGLGRVVFDLAYFQTIGLMKEEVFAAVPLFIFMRFITEQAGLMERLFRAFRNVLAPLRGSLYAVVILTSAVFAMATGIVGAAVTVLGIMAGPMNDQIRLRRRRATSRLSPRERLSLIESAGPARQQMTALPTEFWLHSIARQPSL